MHVSVLKNEVLKYLKPESNENFIDCTINGGGHALAILEKTGPDGKLLGIDWDPEQIEICNLKLGEFKGRVVLVCESFTNLKKIVEEENFKSVSGILFDLGLSSWHLEESKRGFSFLRDEPLDMRYSFENEQTAEKILNSASQEEIERILREYGEEIFAKSIAKRIVRERKKKPIKSTFQLVEIIKKAVPSWYKKQKIHFATRSFLALRIAVNKELDNLKEALPEALEILEPGGRLVVISFHSLEDRIVKNFLSKEQKKETLEIITKKPVRPSEKEIKSNPRSRSAKLRAGVKK